LHEPAAVVSWRLVNLAESTVVMNLDMSTQRRLVDQVRCVVAESPLVRPVARGGQPMRVRVTSAGSLGWVGDGEYHYTATDSRGRPWPAMPEEWRELSDQAVRLDPRFDGTVPNWDSAIINCYDEDASLGFHVDRGERKRNRAIVTFSLGAAASWALRTGRGVSRTRIESGAVTVLGGTLRNAEHSIERIILCPMFSPILDELGGVVPERWSITVREAG
jgi:alkylated DNA repair protein (DNA oxidative demethylase)